MPLLQRLFERCTQNVQKRSTEWTPLDLSNACWGASRIGRAKAPILFEFQANIMMNAIARISLQKFEPNDSFKLGGAPAEIAEGGATALISMDMPKKVELFDAQMLTRAAWAYATAGIASPVFVEHVGWEVIKRADEFTGPQLADVAWAFSQTTTIPSSSTSSPSRRRARRISAARATSVI
ncbi:hypothetical protein M885DRAFT_261593 [Pelagophyceae sp. CCMP2097]|nr:hypothetical protein M885DRAFT_261593 [Pelagophyceae sp. CCMP2097]